MFRKIDSWAAMPETFSEEVWTKEVVWILSPLKIFPWWWLKWEWNRLLSRCSRVLHDHLGDQGPMLHMIFKIFSLKNFAKKLAFIAQNKAKLCKNWIITLVFEKNANFFAEIWQKSQKIVIITSTPDECENKCRKCHKCSLNNFFLKIT
jgi:hypothetical protein